MRFFGLASLAVAFVNPPPVYRQAPAQAQTYYTPYAGNEPMMVPMQGYAGARYAAPQSKRSSAPLAFVAGASSAALALHMRRSKKVSMNAVTERDADGNPVTHYEMFDPIYVVVCLLPYLALLVLNPFA
jgi:hypothetical protein